jgi:hypothetical protein
VPELSVKKKGIPIGHVRHYNSASGISLNRPCINFSFTHIVPVHATLLSFLLKAQAEPMRARYKHQGRFSRYILYTDPDRHGTLRIQGRLDV